MINDTIKENIAKLSKEELEKLKEIEELVTVKENIEKQKLEQINEVELLKGEIENIKSKNNKIIYI